MSGVPKIAKMAILPKTTKIPMDHKGFRGLITTAKNGRDLYGPGSPNSRKVPIFAIFGVPEVPSRFSSRLYRGFGACSRNPEVPNIFGRSIIYLRRARTHLLGVLLGVPGPGYRFGGGLRCIAPPFKIFIDL